MEASPASSLVFSCASSQATCLLGIVAAAASLWGVATDSFFFIVLGLVVWGLFWEASNGATNAIFTDSLSRGDRTKWFSWKGKCQP